MNALNVLTAVVAALWSAIVLTGVAAAWRSAR